MILLGSPLSDEVEMLPEVFGVRLVIWVTAVFVITVLSRGAVAASVRLAWRVGLDRPRRLGRVAALLRAVLWLVGLLAALRPVFGPLPVLTSVAVAVTALFVALALPGLVQSIAAGLSLALRARFREGDHIEVGSWRGSIRTLGLVRTQLRVEDGSTVWIPNARLDADAVRVERATGAAPVTVRFELPTKHRDAALEEVTRAATLLPFRRAGSRPRIVPRTDDERQWTVELQTWATRELDVVRRSLRRTVDAALESHQPRGGDGS